jgi:glycerol-3-phosphate dehydrogenase
VLKRGWRDEVWGRLEEPWDLIVVGGGITGAGILAEAARMGLRALLAEARDFGSGTSSRSTKLVHGGLRYLRQANFRLVTESLRERDLLVREGSGLVTPLGLYLTSFEKDRTSPWVFGLALFLYDVLARKWDHEKIPTAQLLRDLPELEGSGVRLAYRYYDAQTDDARLVLRVIGEGVRHGASALNYARAEGLLRERSGRVAGVVLRDLETGRTAEVRAKVVVNATGAWADELRAQVGGARRLRQIRGSHLVFPASRLPLHGAITLFHPIDHRAVFAIPWEGVTLVGTTDVDHKADLAAEPSMSAEEADYLMALARHAFPSLDLSLGDVRSTYAGVRAVVGTGVANPSKESREHALWKEEGLLTVTGGKLTTFRVMARETLHAVRKEFPGRRLAARGPILDSIDGTAASLSRLDPATQARVLGRYGPAAVEAAQVGDFTEPIGDSNARWGELVWAARAEGVVHLEDLLLRRVRLGLLAEGGGQNLLPRIRTLVQAELGWDDARWQAEERAYRQTWQMRYGTSFTAN